MNNHHHHTFLTKGSLVEVNSDEDSVNGTWYVATVLHPPPPPPSPNQLVYLQYHNLFSSTSIPLREYANIADVRPSPLPEPYPPTFHLNDVVDAFYNNGWWTGVITSLVDGSNFVVSFQNPNNNNQVRFHCSELRIHRIWVGGRWLQPENQGTAGFMYSVGKKVEVSFERESLRDCWVPAIILKNKDNNAFLVEYQQPGSGGEAISHKVTVDYLHIRPSPPHLKDKNFGVLEKVDANYDFGWWSGVITKELGDNRYIVFFKHAKKEREFICSSLRPHMEWKGGNWFNTSQGNLDERTTPSMKDEQIKQTTPSIDKQSTVATSMMKRSKQENPDINDKGSPSSKELQDETVNDDLSNKINRKSVGQSEGLDSEVTGMTDESVHLSNVKKVVSNGRKLTTESSRKRGRPSNALRNLQTTDKGSEVDSIKTRTEEIVEEEDTTKDSPIPVIMGLQCNGMTVSQGKILQKLSIVKTPNVTESDRQQSSVPFSPSTVADEKGSEGDTASLTPKRKRGRPPKLRAISPETSVTLYKQNGGVVPSAPYVVEGGQSKEVDLTTSLVTKSFEENCGPVEQSGIQNASLSKDKMPNDNTEQDLDVRPGRRTRKYSTRKGKRGKQRTVSINIESPAQDSEDASEETRNPESSVGKTKVAPINVDRPEGTEEQLSEASEKLAICVVGSEDLPFVRNKSLWKTIESMEAFKMFPQKPHFRPLLEGVKESSREGLAIGTMVTFSTMVEKTCGMRFDDPRSTIEECLETLVELEDNGFDVWAIRERLTQLLLIKDKQDELAERSKRVAEKIEEQTVQRKRKCDEEINTIDRRIKELQERRKQVVLKEEKWNSEIRVMEAMVEKIEVEMSGVCEEFAALASAPL